MNSHLRPNWFKPVLPLLSAGFLGLMVPQPLMANTNESPNSTIPPTQTQPVTPSNEMNRQTDQTPATRSQPPQDEVRVYISDVYPEYCRSYFARRDWVSLFEYREVMYRCLYGPDRWH
jgi:hypothetical protein